MSEINKYEIHIFPDPEDPTWFCARVPDIPTIFTGGENPEEALKMATDAIEGFLEICKEDRLPIPEPKKRYSGKFNVRVPRELHWALVKLAEEEGISLNALVIYLLSQGVTLPKRKSQKS